MQTCLYWGGQYLNIEHFTFDAINVGIFGHYTLTIPYTGNFRVKKFSGTWKIAKLNIINVLTPVNNSDIVQRGWLIAQYTASAEFDTVVFRKSRRACGVR